MTDAASTSILTGLDWRPQRFGHRSAARIADPVVEPLWDGLRVLVALEGGRPPVVVDEDGEPVEPDEGVEPVFSVLPAAISAESAVLDGYLTTQATRRTEGVALEPAEPMSSTEMIGHFLVGGIATGKAKARQQEAPAGRPPGDDAPPSPIAFVAVDLLMVDGEPVLDVPLLERKRILASVVSESLLVRVTPYVRLPLDTWILSWRAAGFTAMAYKSANGRYVAGGESDDWATAMMPAR